MQSKVIDVVDVVGFYNLPLTECFLIINTCSTQEYERAHPITSWNLPDKNTVTISDVLDRIESIGLDNPPDNTRTMVICGPNAGAVASLIQKCSESDFRGSHVYASSAVSSCERLIIFEQVEKFNQQFPFLTISGQYAYPDDDGGSFATTPAKILDLPLYLGSISHTNKKDVFVGLGIAAVVNATKLVPNEFENIALGPQNITPKYLRCAVADADDQNLSEAFETSFAFIDSAIRANQPVFVHCVEGKSRSASIVVHYLLKSRTSPSLTHALDVVKRCRKCASPNAGFLAQLAQHERIIRETTKEIESRTNWAPLIDSRIVLDKKAARVCHPKFPEAFEITGLFSADECAKLISAAENIGYGKTPYSKSYRGNLRLITMDPSFTAAMWRRMKPTLPETVTMVNRMGKSEKWRVTGLNSCWRLSKYYPSDKFGRHIDAPYYENDKSQSMFTVNAYMNGDFENGNTRFYTNNLTPKPAFSVAPKSGNACVFRQPPGANYQHDGEELGSGVKYLFRSDVMYQLVTE